VFLDLIVLVLQYKNILKKNNFLINKTTLSKLASKKEWQVAFLKFKQSKHQFKQSKLA
jgi:hypothetical protein